MNVAYVKLKNGTQRQINFVTLIRFEEDKVYFTTSQLFLTYKNNEIEEIEFK